MKKVVSALLIMLMLIQTVSFAEVNKVYTEKSTEILVDKLNTFGVFEQFDEELFFGDNANIKRSEAAVVISNVLGMKNTGADSSAEIKFYDVPQYRDYVNAVNYVADLGIMSGNSSGKFLPDDPMELAHVYKALVVALGYKWKAEAYGGYPAGYVKVAAELKFADVLSKGINDFVTKVEFLKLIDAVLDVPICRLNSISGDKMDFEIDEDVTVLTEYHNIYFDEAVVENNKAMTLSSTIKLEDNVVYIGGRKLYVDDVTEVYSYFGKKVEYYYRHDKKAETNYLVAVTPVEENTEIKISREDFKGFADGKITYYNEEGKEKDIKLSSSATVLYNGEIEVNVSNAINNFEGTLTLIDNNDDKMAEVVIAKNYIYDKVKTVKIAENKIYVTNEVFNLDSYETISVVLASTGEVVDPTTIIEGTVIGYAISTDEKKLNIEVLDAGVPVKVTSISKDIFTTEDGKKYNTSLLSAEHKSLIKPNTAVILNAIDGYYAVWAGVASEKVSIGYLINIATETVFSETVILGARILDIDGSIKAYKAANDKKLIVNGKSLTPLAAIDELAKIKDEYRLGGDGTVSQIIGYKISEEGNLTHIYTVDNNDENSPLYLKYGFGRDGLADFYTNHGYGTPRFKSQADTYKGEIKSVHPYYTHNYMITATHPAFIVPDTNQETADEEWYGIRTSIKGYYPSKTGVQLETVTKGKLGIVPKAMVEYLSSDSGGIEEFNVIRSGKLVLIDNTYQIMNNDDGVDYVVNGLCERKEVTYTTNSEEVSSDAVEALKADATDPSEEPGFTTGDIAVIQLDSLDRIIKIEKIYDRETRNIHPDLSPDDTSDQTCALILHTYNKPDDGYALEFFEEDLRMGVPPEKRRLMMSLHAMGEGRVNDKAKTFMFYDDAQEKVYLGSTQNVVDYQQDPQNYTRIFAVHKSSEIIIVFYNYTNN